MYNFINASEVEEMIQNKSLELILDKANGKAFIAIKGISEAKVSDVFKTAFGKSFCVQIHTWYSKNTDKKLVIDSASQALTTLEKVLESASTILERSKLLAKLLDLDIEDALSPSERHKFVQLQQDERKLIGVLESLLSTSKAA